MKCLCPRCTDDPAYTYTEEFRLLCEVREVARIKTQKGLEEYLKKVEEKRGPEGLKRLRDGLIAYWDMRNEDRRV